jgi:hypothetical protein
MGFDEYQVESLSSIKRFWSMVFMTYTFLELFRVSSKKALKLRNLGDTIGYFRKQYLVSIAKFAYTCAALITRLFDCPASVFTKNRASSHFSVFDSSFEKPFLSISFADVAAPTSSNPNHQ